MANQVDKSKRLLSLFAQLPQPNQNIIIFIIEHLYKYILFCMIDAIIPKLLNKLFRVNQFESQNKMSLNNLATVFGPNMLRPGTISSGTNVADNFTAGTIDVMAQADILRFFLRRKASNLSLVCSGTESSC